MASKSLAKLIRKDTEGWSRLKSSLPSLIGEIAVTEFKLNFRRQGFNDTGVEKWKARKKNEYSRAGKRAILNGKGTGNKLKDSIRTLKTTNKSVTVGSTVSYAGVHNYGLRSGRGKGFIMPQRKFVGTSSSLNKKIRTFIVKKINQAFKA